MSTHVETQLTTRQLLKAAAQMPQLELERFVEQMIKLRARHRAPGLSRTESELLTKINQGIPAPLQARYDELIGKRQEDTLSQDEHEELLQLTEQVEGFDVERVQSLAKLAKVRKTTLPALMKDLGIKPQPYV